MQRTSVERLLAVRDGAGDAVLLLDERVVVAGRHGRRECHGRRR